MDINECDQTNICTDSNSICVNTYGSYNCKCPEGYELIDDFDSTGGSICIDVNECDLTRDLIHNCFANQTCENRDPLVDGLLYECVDIYTCLCTDENPEILPWTIEDKTMEHPHEPDEILGRFTCSQGFEGLLDQKGFFTTCHLKIKVPTTWERYTVELIVLMVFLGMIFGFAYYRFKKFIRRRYLLKKAERRRSRKSSESSISNGPGMRARRSSEMVG